MREADIEDMGVKIGGRNTTNLIYFYDTALLANYLTTMKRILYRVDAAGIITIIIIYEFISNLIGLYVKEERLHNPCGFVSDR